MGWVQNAPGDSTIEFMRTAGTGAVCCECAVAADKTVATSADRSFWEECINPQLDHKLRKDGKQKLVEAQHIDLRPFGISVLLKVAAVR